MDVIDSGKIDGELKALARSFVKSKDSGGLGLGLEIAIKSAALTGAKLVLLKEPTTTFRLIWRA